MPYITDILKNSAILPENNLPGGSSSPKGGVHAQHPDAPGGVNPNDVLAQAKPSERLQRLFVPQELARALNGATEITAAALMLDEGIESRNPGKIKAAIRQLDDLQMKAQTDNGRLKLPAKLVSIIELARAEMHSEDGLRRLAENVALKGLVAAERSGNLDDIKAAVMRFSANQKRDAENSALTDAMVQSARAKLFNTDVQTGQSQAIEKGISARAQFEAQLVNFKTQAMLEGAVVSEIEDFLCGKEAPTISESIVRLYTLCGVEVPQNAEAFQALESELQEVRHLFLEAAGKDFTQKVEDASMHVLECCQNMQLHEDIKNFLENALLLVKDRAHQVKCAQDQLHEALANSDFEQLKVALNQIEKFPKTLLGNQTVVLETARTLMQFAQSKPSFAPMLQIVRAINASNYEEMAKGLAALKEKVTGEPTALEERLMRTVDVKLKTNKFLEENLNELAENTKLRDALETAQLTEDQGLRAKALHYIVAEMQINERVPLLEEPLQRIQALMEPHLEEMKSSVEAAQTDPKARIACWNAFNRLLGSIHPMTFTDLQALRDLLPEGTIELMTRVLALPGIDGKESAEIAEIPIVATPEEVEAIWEVDKGPLYGVNNIDPGDPEKRARLLQAIAEHEGTVEVDESEMGLSSVRFLSLSVSLVREINADEAKTRAKTMLEQLNAGFLDATQLDRIRETLETERTKTEALKLLQTQEGTFEERQAARALLADGPGLGVALYEEVRARFLEKTAKFVSEELFGVAPRELDDQGREVAHTDRTVESLKGLLGKLDTQHYSIQELVDTFTQLSLSLPATERANLPEKFVALNRLLEGGAPQTPEERLVLMDAVNALFAKSALEFTDAPLQLKEALLPNDPEFVQAEHSLRLARARLIANLSSGKVKDAKSVLMHLANTGNNVDLGKLITENAHIEAHNFEIANFLLLERAALARGAVRNEDLVKAELEPKDWVTTLKLPQWTVEYAQNLAPQLMPDAEGVSEENRIAWNRLVVAANSYAAQGVSGNADLLSAMARVEKGYDRGVLAPDHELFERLPGWNEAVLLDRLIADLTGLVRPEDRLLNNQRLALNSRVIDGNMRAIVADLDMMLNLERKELSKLEMSNKTCRKALAQYGGLFESKAKLLTFLGAEERTVARLITIKKNLTERTKQMQALKDGVKFAWPLGGRRTQQREIARNVLEFEDVRRELNQLPQDNVARRTELENRLAELRNTLMRVDPKTMRYAKGATLPIGKRDIDSFITEELLPRADALAYFDRTITHSKKSMADVDAERIAIAAKNLAVLSPQLQKAREKFNKTVRNSIEQQISAVTLAAFLKVACESPDGPAISLRVPSQREAVYAQLRAWFVPTDDPVFARMVNRALSDITLPDGTLKTKVFKTSFANKVQAWFTGSSRNLERGKLGDASYKAELRNQGANFSARRAAMSEAFAPKGATNREGRERMFDLALQGNTVTYSQAYGINVDTKAFFTPWSEEGKSFFETSLTGPLSLRFKHLKRGSLSLSKLPGEGERYQVIVKPEHFTRVGANASLKTPLNSLVLSVGANFSYTKADGVALTFPDRESCKRFLDLGLQENPTPEDLKRCRDALLGASQIRFIDEHGVGGDVSTKLVLSALKVKVPNTPLNASAAGAISFSGEIASNHSVQTNARGSTIIARQKGSASVSISATATASGTNPLTNLTVKHSAQLTQKALTKSFTKETRIVTNEMGLSASSSQSHIFTAPAKKSDMDQFRELLLKLDVQKHFVKNRADTLRYKDFVAKVKPSDTIVIEAKLTKRALAQAQQELRLAQATGDMNSKEAKSHIARAGEILNDSASYRPSKLVISTQKRESITDSNPGFFVVQYVHNSALTMGHVSAQLDIPTDNEA